jgi:hypothetical protein
MRAVLIGFAALFAFSAPALAQPVSVPSPAIGTALQEDLEDTYGVREGPYLQALTERFVEEALARAGATLAQGDGAALTVDIIIEEATPNRPTYQQLADRPSLSLASFGVGGARFTAVIRDEGGAVVATVGHAYYETSIFDAFAASTWSDARFAARGFARKVARAYQALG